MAWDDAPPTKKELGDAGPSWDEIPPSPQDIRDSQPGIMNDYVKPALGLIGSAANKIDSYTGAPLRAAIAEDESKGLAGHPISAFANQFGQDPSTAPTGKQLLKGAGINIPETAIPPISPLLAGLNIAGYHPTYNDVAGAGVEMAANPLNVIPGIPEAKAAEQAASSAPEVAAASKGPSIAAKATGSIGETFTGVPKPIIQHYYDNTDKINDLIKTYGQDTAQHAIDVRKSWNDIIKSEMAAQNNKIAQAVRTTPKDPTIDITPVIDHLENSKKALNPANHSDAINQIDAQLNTVKNMSSRVPQGVNSSDVISYASNLPEKYFANEAQLHEIVKDLQNKGSGAYQQAGQIFNLSKPAASASKNAGGVARQILIDEGSGIIPAANKQLQALHQIEDTMNPNLLKPEGPPNALFKAATNPGGFEANSLKKLSQITGHDFISDAKDFATTQSMARSPALPIDVTGKAMARQNLGKSIGAGIGGLTGYLKNGTYESTGIGAYLGGKVGTAATSPIALKSGINALNTAGKVGRGLINQAAPISRGLIVTRPAANGLVYGQ